MGEGWEGVSCSRAVPYVETHPTPTPPRQGEGLRGRAARALLSSNAPITKPSTMKPGQISVASSDFDEVEETLRAILSDVLGLPRRRVDGFNEATALFGALPELDSMAVATLLTAIEERLGVLIEDDDVEAEDFATYGRLLAFARRKALQ